MGCLKQKVSRITIILFILTGLFICTGMTVYAADPYASGTVCEGGANVRSSYSTDAGIVTTLAEYATVTITKEKHTSSSSTSSTTRWFYIKNGSAKGWMRADCLDVSYGTVTATTTAAVNVRKGPGTGFTVVGSFGKGDSVQVRLKAESSSGSTWYKVSYDGSYCYISGSYLEFPENNTGYNANFENELAAFPASYHKYLTELHELHPSWHFEAKVLPFTWSDALREQISNPGTNTVQAGYLPAYAYKAVSKATYNFDTGTHISFDSGNYVSASESAVAYFMDPRNWLEEYTVFMFEKLKYDPSTQLKDTVENILKETAIPVGRAESYMIAAEDYNVSPVYLAAKSKVELGGYDTMISGGKFTYGGKTYKGYYNAYNIGAYKTSNATAVQNGLYYAATVDPYYLGPWNTLDRAIRGGAKFIAEDFIGNNQHTIYYQHFNVANGLSNVGTHPYMTAIYGPYNEAWMQATDYHDSGLLDSAFTFEIPVYKDMSPTPASAPPKGNNNYYLDSLKVYDGDTRKSFTASFSRFTSTYTLKNEIPYETETLTVKAVTNADDAKVTVSGNKNLEVGENKITVKVTSSSGLVKRYYVKLTRSEAKGVTAPEVKIGIDVSSGKIKLTWEPVPNADEYQIYRATSKDGTYKKMNTQTGTTYINKASAVPGKKYYYKVKAVGTEGITGEAISDIVYRICDLPQPVVSAGVDAASGKVKLTWDAIDGAVKYEVYRATSKDGTYKKMNTQKGTTYINKVSAVPGKKYYYKVKAIHENSSANSAYSEVKYRICDLPQPVVTAGVDAASGKVKLTWEAIDGAAKYEVHRATSKDGTYKKMNTQKGTTYINKVSAVPGEKYYYKVKAIHENSSANSAYSEVKYRICDLPRPVVTAGNDDETGKVKLTWDAIDGAVKYEVYRATSKNGTYKKMNTQTGTTYVNKASVVEGKRYYYKVKAIHKNSSANSAYSKVVSGGYNL